jgi:hypothetical protein
LSNARKWQDQCGEKKKPSAIGAQAFSFHGYLLRRMGRRVMPEKSEAIESQTEVMRNPSRRSSFAA